MKKIISTIFVLAFALCNAYAQEASSPALGFSRIDYNPVSAAMGGASIASSSSTAYAAFGNIAMAAFADKKVDATLSYQMWAPTSANGKDLSLGFGGRFGNLAVSVAAAYNMYPAVDKNKPSDLMAGAGLAYNIKDIVSVGANFRYAMQKLTNKHSMGAFMADVYVGTKIKGFSAVAGISNIGTKAVLNKKQYAIPTSVRFGLGYDKTFAQKHYVQVLADADYYLSKSFSASFGAQYGFNDMVFIRGGYRYGGKSVIPSYASVGLGLKFYGVKIEFSYMIANEILKNTLSVGLGYAF